jgi:type I restriction enzyme R subunit
VACIDLFLEDRDTLQRNRHHQRTVWNRLQSGDQLFFDQIIEAATTDEALQQAAVVNPGDKFELVFKNLLETLFVERMDQNEEIFARFMNDAAFQKVVTGWLSSEAYKRLRAKAEGISNLPYS